MNLPHSRLFTAALLLGVSCGWPVHAEPALPPVLLPNAVMTTAPVTAASAQTSYRVRRGDSLDRILVKEFGLAPAALKQWRAIVVAQNPSVVQGWQPAPAGHWCPAGTARGRATTAAITPTIPTTPEQPRAAIYYYGH